MCTSCLLGLQSSGYWVTMCWGILWISAACIIGVEMTENGLCQQYKSVITFSWIWNVRILIPLLSSISSMLSASYLILSGFFCQWQSWFHLWVGWLLHVFACICIPGIFFRESILTCLLGFCPPFSLEKSYLCWKCWKSWIVNSLLFLQNLICKSSSSSSFWIHLV